MSDQKLQWHPAFQAALQIELEEDAPYLQFHTEYNLAKKPQQIDILIRKKAGYVCKKKLARFFRGHNIIEYKSPGDYFSVNDFYKLISYAGNYQSDTKKVLEIRPEDITLTIVCDRFPRKLEKHLRSRYGAKVRKKYPAFIT